MSQQPGVTVHPATEPEPGCARRSRSSTSRHRISRRRPARTPPPGDSPGNRDGAAVLLRCGRSFSGAGLCPTGRLRPSDGQGPLGCVMAISASRPERLEDPAILAAEGSADLPCSVAQSGSDPPVRSCWCQPRARGAPRPRTGVGVPPGSWPVPRHIRMYTRPHTFAAATPSVMSAHKPGGRGLPPRCGRRAFLATSRSLRGSLERTRILLLSGGAAFCSHSQSDHSTWFVRRPQDCRLPRGAATATEPKSSPRAAAIGHKQPREPGTLCVPARRSRSSGTAPGAPDQLVCVRSTRLAAADGSAPPRAPERALVRPLRRQLLYRRVRKGFLGCGRNVPLGTRAHSGCMDRVDLSHAVPPPKLEHAASLR